MPHARMPPARQWPALVPAPDSITWRRAGDGRLLLAAGYALLLQVSHPTVGAGVSEHSRFRSDPWRRLLRTLDYTYTMVYGGPQAAGQMGRRIRAMHARFRGQRPDGRPYHALEPAPYAWVHATLAEAIVAAHERFGCAFSPAERERFWREWRALGRLLGIGAHQLPGDWKGFRVYVHSMTGQLERTAAVDEVLEALQRPAPPQLPSALAPAWLLARIPLARVLGLASVGMLAPGLRARLGLSWSAASELQLRALGAALRASTPLMPAWLANTGPGYLRRRGPALAA
jgi:uncharacterized protein (DUF2236 family)